MRVAVIGGLLMAVAGCATRAVPPVVTAPRHPDFIFPAPPQGAAPAVVEALQRGWQFLQGGDLRNAEREFGLALRASPSSASPETAFGYVALSRGNADGALPRFDRALSRQVAYVPALVGRGQALMALQREGDALASYEAALAADPSLTDLQARVDVLRFRATQDLLARAKSATDAGRLDEARNAYQQAIAASPDSAFLYRELAVVERRAGEVALGIEHLRRAIDLEPGDARTHVSLGDLLEAQGDVVGALAAFEQGRSLDPSAVPPETLARARDGVAMLKMPTEYRAIATVPQVTRAELAALIGVRLEVLVARAAPRQVVITDVRGHWAERWITAVVRASVMDTLPNYQFDPAEPIRRGDLARTVARVLTLTAAIRPAAARTWENARMAIADVAPGHLTYPAVSMAVASGVMSLEGGAFRLLDPVSGAEAVEIVARLEALAR